MFSQDPGHGFHPAQGVVHAQHLEYDGFSGCCHRVSVDIGFNESKQHLTRFVKHFQHHHRSTCWTKQLEFEGLEID